MMLKQLNLVQLSCSKSEIANPTLYIPGSTVVASPFEPVKKILGRKIIISLIKIKT